MVILLAGRAAEDLIFGDFSTGAADDLAKVTDVARQIVTRFGMSEELGQAVLEEQRSSYLGESMLNIKERDYSEATAREVDLAVRKLIDSAYAQAKDILQARKKALMEGAELLLKNETITPDDFPPLRPSGDARAAAE
jgi:cell division protease FtsH